jgi:RNA polymerase sigma factor (TIGR02999 family)
MRTGGLHWDPASFRDQVSTLRRQFLQDGDFPFTNVLTEEVIAQTLATIGGWLDRIFSPFFAAAADAMRRILIDQARQKATARHNAGRQRQPLDPDAAASPQPREDLLALDEALDKLAAEDPLKANLVKLRYFVGMSLAETAAALGLSERTAGRHWAYARAWLRRTVEGAPGKK